MCGSSTNTSSTTSSASPEVSAAYKDLLSRAKGVADQPLQQYQGDLVAGFTPDQTTAFSDVRNAQGIWSPYYKQSASYLDSSAKPIQSMTYDSSTVNNLLNPYTQDVVDKTQKYFDTVNDRTAAKTDANSAMYNAYGGDRGEVAKSLAKEENDLVQEPIIAGLYSKGYDNAQSEFNTLNNASLQAQTATGWLQQGAGQNYATLGKDAQTSSYADADALYGSGSKQQSQNQSLLNVPYDEYLQQQAYPFQTTGWLGNLALGIGSNSGGTSTTKTPGSSYLSQATGLGLTGLGAYGLYNDYFGSGSGSSYSSPTVAGNSSYSIYGSALPSGGSVLGGGYTSGGRIGFADGGSPLPASPFSAIDLTNNNIPDVSMSYVPTGSAGGTNLAGSALKPTVSTTNQSGGGSGLMGDIGTALTLAKFAMMFAGANRGGRVGFADGGGSVAPITHQAATLINIPDYVKATPASLDSLQSLVNYAPTFDASGYPGPLMAVTPRSTSPAPLSIPLTTGGVLDRASLNPVTSTASTDTSGSSAATTTDTRPAPFDFSTVSDNGGGAWRGGRTGFASGGLTYGDGTLQATPSSDSWLSSSTPSTNSSSSSTPNYSTYTMSAPVQSSAGTTTDPTSINDSIRLAQAIGYFTNPSSTSGQTGSSTGTGGSTTSLNSTRGYLRGGRMGFADGGDTDTSDTYPGPLTVIRNFPDYFPRVMDKAKRWMQNPVNHPSDGTPSYGSGALSTVNPQNDDSTSLSVSPDLVRTDGLQMPIYTPSAPPAVSSPTPSYGSGVIVPSSDSDYRAVPQRAGPPVATVQSSPTDTAGTLKQSDDYANALDNGFKGTIQEFLAQQQSGGSGSDTSGPSFVPSLSAPFPRTSSDQSGQSVPWEVAKPTIARYESVGLASKLGIDPYYIGTGGTDLSNYPDALMDKHGFPNWEGVSTPKGRSTAAGLLQTTQSTWDDVVDRHFGGYLDWRVPANQDAVGQILYAERGWQPWAPNNPSLASAIGIGAFQNPTGTSATSILSPSPNSSTNPTTDTGGGPNNGPSIGGGPAITSGLQPRQKSIYDSPWMPLLAAGLGMMASRNPNPLGGIGEGGLAGINALAQQKGLDNRELMAETRNQAMLNTAQRYADQADLKRQSLTQSAQSADDRNNATLQRLQMTQQAIDAKIQAGQASEADKELNRSLREEIARMKRPTILQNVVHPETGQPTTAVVPFGAETDQSKWVYAPTGPKQPAAISQQQVNQDISNEAKALRDTGMDPDKAETQARKTVLSRNGILIPGKAPENPVEVTSDAQKQSLAPGTYMRINGKLFQKPYPKSTVTETP